MLSNTKGLSRVSRTLGYHRDDLSTLRHVCHAWKSTGKCKAYNKELEVRRTIAAAKEAELLKKATALYEAQMDLIADLGDEEGAADALASLASAQPGFSTDPDKKKDMIQRLVAELKQEPAYLNWSLDAAVAERLVQLQVKPCRYSHRGEVSASLKRSRSAQEREDDALQQQQEKEQQQQLQTAAATASEVPSDHRPTESSPVAAAARHQRCAAALAEQWAEERHRIFNTLTPLQRCVVCLLWQRTYRVPQGVVCDVRLMLEKQLADAYDKTGRVIVDGNVVAEKPSAGAAADGGHGDGEDVDPLDSFLGSAAFEQLVEREAARVVTRVAFRPEYGMVDLSALPLLVAHLSTHAASGVILARTLTYFTGMALPPMEGTAAQKQQDQKKTTDTTTTTTSSSSSGGRSAEGKGSEKTDARNGADSSRDASGAVEDQRPAPVRFHNFLFPRRVAVTEKEIDLGGSARADELAEALEWTLHVYRRDAQLHGSSSSSDLSAAHPSSPSSAMSHVTALFRSQRVRLHGLTLRHCKMTDADALIQALHKRRLELYLYALDLSDNRLWSLRFLLVLRAHFAQRLLRLSLRSNPITRKPEYQEQVRRSLPQLTSLDGEPIRRPPLRLPKPLPSSCTRHFYEEKHTSPLSQSTEKERKKDAKVEGVHDADAATVQAEVLDCVNRFLYIWETRRIPRTLRELAYARERRRGDAHAHDGGVGAEYEEEEEDMNEDNFPHRYLHPAATFSVTMAPGLSFYDKTAMQDARAVELDASYAGMRLSAVDVRDARVFDVAMKNSSRNLLAGRPALQRFGKGADNCYAAYQFTLYPERMMVEHHITDALISIATVNESTGNHGKSSATSTTKAAAAGGAQAPSNSKREKKSQSGNAPPPAPAAGAAVARFGSLARGPTPSQYVVTLHGTMTWQLPSMKASECMRAAYTRVMVFTKKVLPAQNREWERLRSPPYVLLNDQLFLFPTPESIDSSSSCGGGASGAAARTAAASPSAVYRANTAGRLSRLVVEFGLEACRDGLALVRDVMERCTSAASEYAALQALVLGFVSAPSTATTNNEPATPSSSISIEANSNDKTKKNSGTKKTLAAAVGGHPDAASQPATEEAIAAELAHKAAAQLTPLLHSYVCSQSTFGSAPAESGGAARTYVIFSVLESADADGAASVAAAEPQPSHNAQPSPSVGRKGEAEKGKTHKMATAGAVSKKHRDKEGTKVAVAAPLASSPAAATAAEHEAISKWAAKLHVVTRALLNDVTEITNACYTAL